MEPMGGDYIVARVRDLGFYCLGLVSDVQNFRHYPRKGNRSPSSMEA